MGHPVGRPDPNPVLLDLHDFANLAQHRRISELEPNDFLDGQDGLRLVFRIPCASVFSVVINCGGSIRVS